MLLNRGKVYFQGPTSNLKRESIERVYNLKILEVNEKGFRGFIPIIK